MKGVSIMLGDFVYSNPTKLYFGRNALENLHGELKKYGKRVLLVYGGGSIKKNGIYDDIMKILQDEGKEVTELPGVMSNPTIHKLHEGMEVARKADVDFILAAGGGSVIDYAKALSASVCCDDDPWEKYFIRGEEPECRTISIGIVLTMAGTGSEMNGGSVITYPEKKLKIGHVFADDNLKPRFSIMNPLYTMTLPKYQVVAGIYDTFNHICEQYFSGTDDNTSDYLAEGLMRNVIESGRKVAADLNDYEARSNLMWDATWALNTLLGMGKTMDWMVHMLGQSAGGCTNATHGMTLAAMSLPYYRFIMKSGLPKFVRFAKVVWNVEVDGKTDEQIAAEGLDRMESWMKEIGLVLHLKELGATEDMLDDLVNGTLILDGGYQVLKKEDIRKIFEEAM